MFAIYLLVWWGIKQARNNENSIDIAFSCILVIVILLLLATQLWGALVVWRIGAQVYDRYNEDEKASHQTHSVHLQPGSTTTLATIPEDGVPAQSQSQSQSRNSVVDMTRKMKKRSKSEIFEQLEDWLRSMIAVSSFV